MPSINITDDQHDRITALCEELADAHANNYTSVTLPDVVAYLLDLADAVDDPERCAEIKSENDSADHRSRFPRAELEATLSERNRRHAEEPADRPMDLYSIATEYDIGGRSNMTKQELITAILDTVERRYTEPLAPVDIDFPREEEAADDNDSMSGELSETPADTTETGGETRADTTEIPAGEMSDEADGDGQLNAMLSLLETHQDKWREADGDARYEVDLPDGSTEAVRTKDDVRATLFRHY